MFACIFFFEDTSLSVVGKNDKNLTIITEFSVKESVEMIWKDAGKSKLFHGVIVKVHGKFLLSLHIFSLRYM